MLRIGSDTVIDTSVVNEETPQVISPDKRRMAGDEDPPVRGAGYEPSTCWESQEVPIIMIMLVQKRFFFFFSPSPSVDWFGYQGCVLS